MFNSQFKDFESNAKRRVLVVDDEQAIRECVSALVSMLGFQVVQARNGSEALDRYTKSTGAICLVIMDVSMPELDGIEAMHKMKELDPNVKIILCSGRPLVELVNHGADGIVLKPFRGQTICAVVEEVLKARGGEAMPATG